MVKNNAEHCCWDGEGEGLYVRIDIRTADASIIPQISTYISCNYFSANALGLYIELALIL